MREMTSLASAYDRKRLPASLMERLSLMQQLALAAQANGQPQRQPRRPRRGAHAIVLAWFSLGVLTSGALGAGTIVAMRSHAAGGAPLASVASLASMDWAAWARAPAAAAAPERGAAWDTVQVAMGRAERAPLPLQVTGVDGAAFEVVIESLPAGVRPSRGAPRGQAWVLGRDDLDGLFLALDATAPAAFDVKVALSVSPGVATTGSILQVRLSDAVEQPQTAVTDRREAPHVAAADTGISGAQAGGDKAKVGRETTDPGKRRTAATIASAARRQPWPEGASALGAVSREPDRPSWWQMPPPSWSPFVVGQERP